MLLPRQHGETLCVVLEVLQVEVLVLRGRADDVVAAVPRFQVVHFPFAVLQNGELECIHVGPELFREVRVSGKSHFPGAHDIHGCLALAKEVAGSAIVGDHQVILEQARLNHLDVLPGALDKVRVGELRLAVQRCLLTGEVAVHTLAEHVIRNGQRPCILAVCDHRNDPLGLELRSKGHEVVDCRGDRGSRVLEQLLVVVDHPEVGGHGDAVKLAAPYVALQGAWHEAVLCEISLVKLHDETRVHKGFQQRGEAPVLENVRKLLCSGVDLDLLLIRLVGITFRDEIHPGVCLLELCVDLLNHRAPAAGAVGKVVPHLQGLRPEAARNAQSERYDDKSLH